jgi:YidC/Oxa1 family membrane protein insertase
MVLAFVLMGLILVVTPWAYRKLGITAPESAAVTQPKKAAPKPASTPPNTASGTPVHMTEQPGAQPAPPPANLVSAAAEQQQIIDTSLYRVVFSNRGAVVKSWTLKNYKDSADKPLELVNVPGAQKVGYPFSLAFRSEQCALGDASRAGRCGRSV